MGTTGCKDGDQRYKDGDQRCKDGDQGCKDGDKRGVTVELAYPPVHY